jgi:hypothetical protein
LIRYNKYRKKEPPCQALLAKTAYFR